MSSGTLLPFSFQARPSLEGVLAILAIQDSIYPKLCGLFFPTRSLVPTVALAPACFRFREWRGIFCAVRAWGCASCTPACLPITGVQEVLYRIVRSHSAVDVESSFWGGLFRIWTSSFGVRGYSARSVVRRLMVPNYQCSSLAPRGHVHGLALMASGVI
jgi:hypothetical protein